MKDTLQKRVLILALYAGEIMMKSGAEIYRVEDTIVRICRACRIDYVECFATTTGIFLSLDSGRDENDMHTFIKRIGGTGIDLLKISRINHFSRVFTTTDLSVADGFEQLREINAAKSMSVWIRILGAMLVGAFLAPYFGASILDMTCAAITSGLSYCIALGIEKLRFPSFIRIFVSCAGCALLVLSLSSLGLGHSVSPVLIGGTAIFMPGVAITNAARDMLSGDMLSGVARFTEALIAAVAIAGGIGAMMKIWFLLGGEIAPDDSVEYEPGFFFLFGFFTTVGFCILFNAPKKLIPLISGIGAVGMFAMAFGVHLGYGAVGSAFIGSCIVAILAECSSRAGRDATTVFILPGIIPFVPGATIYKTMENILDGNFASATSNGVETFATAGSIAVALILIASVVRLFNALLRRIRHLPDKSEH
ncbi:MAG: threonine/serine exporter family protein [Clostridiales Family XIII bacterium]|jgi:uncharacterized membrane protein YjjP (DUF1212 family)|nr:threonine/serine exporter family protein [Clostridiales Family XIII bacterium]